MDDSAIDSTIVWMNGELMRADEVRISPFDLGLTVGVGVFETMQAYDGRVFAYDRHHLRMEISLTGVAVQGTLLPSADILKKAISDVLMRNELNHGRARVRMSLSGGVNPLSGGPAPGNLIITAVSQAAPEPLAMLDTVSFPCNEFSDLVGVKSSSFADNVFAWRFGLSSGADEVVRLNSASHLCECAMSNLFLVRDGVVMTPDLESGCLEGVTRAIVLELCDELELDSVACELDLEDLHAADELFITSSIREVQPAEMLDLDADRPHPVTLMLVEAYRKRVCQELGLLYKLGL